jgi:hypothetical protein
VHGGINPQILEMQLNLTQINRKIRDNLHSRSYFIAFSEELKFLFTGQGPLWYRGFVPDDKYARTTPGQISDILEYFSVDNIVIGHSNQERIESFYDGRVFAIDILYEELHSFHGLLWQSGRFYRVSGDGRIEIIE